MRRQHAGSQELAWERDPMLARGLYILKHKSKQQIVVKYISVGAKLGHAVFGST